MFAASFQANSQPITSRIEFANKAQCAINIDFVTCLGSSHVFVLPPNASHIVNLYNNDIPKYVRGDFPGGSSPDVVRYYSPCMSGSNMDAPNACYGQNVDGITYFSGSNSYWFAVW